MALLSEAGIAATACADLASLASTLGDNATLVVISEEAVRLLNVAPLKVWIDNQPPWSDLPFIVMTQRGGGPESNPSAARLADTLGNLTFLERPFHPTTFASMARTAYRARHRQFEARNLLDELHESQEKLATAMLAGKLGSWSIDLATETLLTSPLCRAIYGVPENGKLTYVQLLSMIHPGDLGAMQEAVQRSVDHGEDYNVEYRISWPDGSVRWVQVNGRTLRDPDGSTRGLVGVAMDITSRKEAEAALRRVNDDLERRVAERAAQLERSHARVLDEARQREEAEEQLRQAQKMEVIGQLTGGIAHDFNNLLMAVLTNVALLRKHAGDDARALKLIDGAEQGAKRGAALTQRLLAFARRQSLKVDPVDVGALVEGLRNLLERSVGADVELDYRIGGALHPVMIDANQVELALLNLVVNARDAMPDGGAITIAADEVRCEEAADLPAGRFVRLSVIDTGVGMDEETLQRAIEPFFSTKELGKGTGLGLSMIHGLAVQLNGALRLSSTPGQGTRADLYLPVSTRPIEVSESAMPSTPETSEPAFRARILLVDDDVLIAMSTAGMLEDLGHEVIEANSGASALEALRANQGVDLMITDFAMPGMNGAQLAMEARLLLPDLPILLATGYAEMPKGANIELPRLGKPYSQTELAREIGRLLHNGRDRPTTSA
ncbi:MAG: ATP-binding protein [Hyphomonadaceae bacterium]